MKYQGKFGDIFGCPKWKLLIVFYDLDIEKSARVLLPEKQLKCFQKFLAGFLLVPSGVELY